MQVRKWKGSGNSRAYHFNLSWGKMASIFHCNTATGHLLLTKNNGNGTLGVVGKAQIMLGHRNLWLFCKCSNPITACRSLVYNVSCAGQIQQLACFSTHLRRYCVFQFTPSSFSSSFPLSSPLLVPFAFCCCCCRQGLPTWPSLAWNSSLASNLQPSCFSLLLGYRYEPLWPAENFF